MWAYLAKIIAGIAKAGGAVGGAVGSVASKIGGAASKVGEVASKAADSKTGKALIKSIGESKGSTASNSGSVNKGGHTAVNKASRISTAGEATAAANRAATMSASTVTETAANKTIQAIESGNQAAAKLAAKQAQDTASRMSKEAETRSTEAIKSRAAQSAANREVQAKAQQKATMLKPQESAARYPNMATNTPQDTPRPPVSAQKPSLARQMGATVYEKNIAPVQQGVGMIGDLIQGLTGSSKVSDFAHRMGDTQSFRTAGKLSASKAPEKTRGEALSGGLSKMLASSKRGVEEIRQRQGKQEEELESLRQAGLKHTYPGLF